MKTLGELLKDYREEHSLSLRNFATQCNISHSYIDKLEKGIDPRNGQPVEPTLDMIEKLAKAMGLSLDSLLRAIGKIDATENSPSKVNNLDTLKSVALSEKDEKDVEKRMQKMRDDLLSDADGLMFSGNPMSPEAIESVLSALEFGMKQAKLINKKYTPKKYRKEK